MSNYDPKFPLESVYEADFLEYPVRDRAGDSAGRRHLARAREPFRRNEYAHPVALTLPRAGGPNYWKTPIDNRIRLY